MANCDLFTVGKEDLLSVLDGWVEVQVQSANYTWCNWHRSEVIPYSAVYMYSRFSTPPPPPPSCPLTQI